MKIKNIKVELKEKERSIRSSVVSSLMALIIYLHINSYQLILKLIDFCLDTIGTKKMICENKLQLENVNTVWIGRIYFAK